MADATRGVTSRELGRHAAALLDEVERSGRCVVISRFGRAVAYLGPIPEDYVPGDFERVHVVPRFTGTAALATEDDEVSDEELAELGEEERFMLIEIAAVAPLWWMPRDTEEVRMHGPRHRLEDRDLIESRAGGGWKVTARGMIAARGVAR
jgi:antitoxin (DNA-binding transcriptional repressor) of toxin-antitoxin stability system